MTQALTIALDAMGGDHGPEIVVNGADIALQRHPGLRFLLFGDEGVVRPQLDQYSKVAAASDLIHTDIAVAMDAKPSQALREGRRTSSMWLAIDAVKRGEADATISAGNTGALMAMAKIHLRTMAEIDRPAIAAIWPTLRGESVVLDVGATVGADSSQLVDFALMGEAMARALFDLERPTVGLLNIGVEEVKGLDEVKEASRQLKELNLPLKYCGFVEGTDIGKGTVDVVVTEGFTGNIALKTAEGTARQMAQILKEELNRTLLTRIGALFARRAFTALKSRMDPNRNGGIFLGLNGIVIKSHGGADATGFANAIELGYDMAKNELVSKIAQDIERYHNPGPAQAAS